MKHFSENAFQNNVYSILFHVEGILPKGPTRHAYAWQIGPFWQDILDVWYVFDDIDDVCWKYDKSVMSVLEKYAPIKTKL